MPYLDADAIFYESYVITLIHVITLIQNTVC